MIAQKLKKNQLLFKCFMVFKKSNLPHGFRQDGKDPLDHIYILLNRGAPNQPTPEHWHFVTLGFSDLHGDDRVHEYVDCLGENLLM